jgi:preprotein translocase subunit SecF
MAIDMIENCDMSALAGSRLGMQNFADDGGQYMNLFGSQIRDYAKRATETLKKQLSLDCDKIDESIAIIQADIAANIKRSATERADSLKKTKMQIQMAQELLGQYEKSKITNCTKIDDAKKVAEEAKFQETLTKITEGAVEQAKKDVGGATITEKIQNNKPLVIGGAIIVIGVVAFLMFKKN